MSFFSSCCCVRLMHSTHISESRGNISRIMRLNSLGHREQFGETCHVGEFMCRRYIKVPQPTSIMSPDPRGSRGLSDSDKFLHVRRHAAPAQPVRSLLAHRVAIQISRGCILSGTAHSTRASRIRRFVFSGYDWRLLNGEFHSPIAHALRANFGSALRHPRHYRSRWTPDARRAVYDPMSNR